MNLILIATTTLAATIKLSRSSVKLTFKKLSTVRVKRSNLGAERKVKTSCSFRHNNLANTALAARCPAAAAPQTPPYACVYIISVKRHNIITWFFCFPSTLFCLPGETSAARSANRRASWADQRCWSRKQWQRSLQFKKIYIYTLQVPTECGCQSKNACPVFPNKPVVSRDVFAVSRSQPLDRKPVSQLKPCLLLPHH